MTEHLTDVKDLTPEQQARVVQMANWMSMSYWGLHSAARVIVRQQDEIERLKQDAARDAGTRAAILGENTHYKQVARAAQDEIARLEHHIIERQPLKVTELPVDADYLPSGWITLSRAYHFIMDHCAVDGSSFIHEHWDCKYINARIDMRTGKVLLSPGNARTTETTGDGAK